VTAAAVLRSWAVAGADDRVLGLLFVVAGCFMLFLVLFADGARRLVFAVAVGAGVCGVACAALFWRRLGSARTLLRAGAAALVITSTAAAAALLLPGDDLRNPLPDGLVRDFRVVSLVGQILLWGVLALVGAGVVRHVTRRDA
jgi:predicted cobalt transporter CbtA